MAFQCVSRLMCALNTWPSHADVPSMKSWTMIWNSYRRSLATLNEENFLLSEINYKLNKVNDLLWFVCWMRFLIMYFWLSVDEQLFDVVDDFDEAFCKCGKPDIVDIGFSMT